MRKKTAIVVGAGIVGLATARALAVRGCRVTVIDKSIKAIGASVRNFGMVWPIGQPDGELYERALLSRSIWKEICTEAGIWFEEAGSIHVAYEKDEWIVLNELQEIYRHRGYRLLDASETKSRSAYVVREGLAGSLYSEQELIIDPRKAMAAIPVWLNKKYGVEFIWGHAVTDILYPGVFTGNDVHEADLIYVCSGADFETLYPDLYSAQAITKCKLQMMRLGIQPVRIGPSICGGLSLLHYDSFKKAPSSALLQKRFREELPEYIAAGIHVMVSQNSEGALTVGDSHEYGIDLDPFDRASINFLILDYLRKFSRFPVEEVTESWHGIYPKMTNGSTEVILEPEPGVQIINGLGGAGMTLSFGLCEKLIARTW